MERSKAIADCLAKMNEDWRFAEHDDEQKAKAAAYTFDRLSEDAAQYLPAGCSEEDFKHYVKAATRRLHAQASALPASEFEQRYGCPVLLVLTLIPLIWAWRRMLRDWFNS